MRFDPILKAAVEHHRPAGLIYVGSSGDDTTQLWPFTDSKNIIWISSSSNLQEKIKKQPQKFKNTIPYFEYASKQTGTIDFYDVSLSEFSGIINPIVLKTYWQNIKTMKTGKRAATTLDKLCSQNSKVHNAWLSANWLIIDQLAALDTLQGGQGVLSQLDGMIIKVFLPDQSPCTPELMTSSLEQISQWLKHHNFTAVVQKKGRHKSFAHVLFVRNWKAEYESLSIKREEAKNIIHDVSGHNDKLKQQLAAKQKIIKGLTEEQIRAQENQENLVSEMNGKLKDVQTQKDDAQAEYAKQLNMMQADLEAKLQSSDKLSKERNKHQKETVELENKIENNLEQIATLNKEAKDLKSKLISVQDVTLQKEKQAELHLQNLEFLREKFKDMKKKHDGNIELLKNVQAKLLAAVQGKSAQQPGGNTTEKLN